MVAGTLLLTVAHGLTALQNDTVTATVTALPSAVGSLASAIVSPFRSGHSGAERRWLARGLRSGSFCGGFSSGALAVLALLAYVGA